MTDWTEGILETAIYAADLDAAEGFYGDVLGLAKITRHANRHVFYRAGQGVLLIFNPAETEHPPEAGSLPGSLPVPTHGARGPGHVCFRVRADALDALGAHLVACGQRIEADFRWPNGARSIYLRDPAGNSVEFAAPELWQPAENGAES